MSNSAYQLCVDDHPPFVYICTAYAQALQKLGYEVTTVFSGTRGFSDDTQAIPGSVHYRKRPFPSGTRPDIVIAHRFRSYRAALTAKGRPRIVVVSHEAGMFRTRSRRLRRRLSRPVAYAGISRVIIDDFERVGIHGAEVLPNTIDLDEIRRNLLTRAAARDVLSLPQDAFVVGMVGRLHPVKEPLRAIKPFLAFRETCPNAILAYLGEGVMRPVLERAIAENMSSRAAEPVGAIRLLGVKPGARALLPALDVLLSTATRETFGMVFLEAMAANVPVIARDSPGPFEALGPCARYFNTDAELIDALEDVAHLTPQDHAEAARQAEARLRSKFTTEVLTTRLEAILTKATH